MGHILTPAVRRGDGNGLYLAVQPTGSRNWVQRLVVRGRRRDLGLGGFPLVSLREAREAAFANRKVARSGGDPAAEKRRTADVVTFAEAAERVWKDKNPGWRHPGHAQEWMSSLRRHALLDLGKMPVSDISSAEVLDTLRRIWHARPETARRVRQRISAVMDWAIAMQFRTDNPCDRLGPFWDRSRTRCSTCARCPTARLQRRSGPCGARERQIPSSWRSSFSC